ncbi:MAG: HRDC domain-containing protein, partial [Spirochaetales bacterium]|nr:HRDC domain-containing protein [Spirochaetales bacterium]
MIETEQELERVMQQAHAVDAVALDTEFVWERTYYPRLGLIQLALAQDQCFLIDPLAIKDLSSLGKLLADDSVVKIFHDGSQDLAILQRETGANPKNIFDTRMAAGFAGLPSILSLLDLVKELLDITLTKTQTRTNWLKRPLNSSQMQYGLDDVRYLRVVRRMVLEQAQKEPLVWMGEELQKFDDPESYLGIADNQRYVKIRGTSRLNQAGLAILRDLGIWREKEARKRNKPRGHIIRDDVLLFIAQQQLHETQALHGCEGISDKSISQYGKAMLEVVQQALSQSADYPELLRNERMTRSEEGQLRDLQGWIRKQAEYY